MKRILAAFLLLLAFAARANANDIHVTGSAPTITIANALPNTSIGSPSVYITANPDRSANAIISWVKVSGADGVANFRAFCTYNTSVADYSNNTQYWIELGYLEATSVMQAGSLANLSVTGLVPAIADLGAPGCAQYAFVFSVSSGLSPSVSNILLTVLPGQQALAMGSVGTNAMLAYPGVLQPTFNNNNIPNNSPFLVAGQNASNVYSPLRLDTQNNLFINCKQGCSGQLGTFTDNTSTEFGNSINPGVTNFLASQVVGNLFYGGAFSGGGGSGLSGWSHAYTSTVFKTCTATASGDTACWTPHAGNSFRLLGYSIEVTEDATLAVAADLDITLRDATTSMNIVETCFTPTTATVTYVSAGCGSRGVNLGFFGKLSAAPNNALNVNLSAALTAGKVRVNLWGTEE